MFSRNHVISIRIICMYFSNTMPVFVILWLIKLNSLGPTTTPDPDWVLLKAFESCHSPRRKWTTRRESQLGSLSQRVLWQERYKNFQAMSPKVYLMVDSQLSWIWNGPKTVAIKASKLVVFVDWSSVGHFGEHPASVFCPFLPHNLIQNHLHPFAAGKNPQVKCGEVFCLQKSPYTCCSKNSENGDPKGTSHVAW